MTTMATNAATDRMKHDLRRTLDCMRHDLSRVEILTAALAAFARPVPDYEPAFQHLRHTPLTAHEMEPQSAEN